MKTIKEVKEYLAQCTSLDDPELILFKEDQRKGVQQELQRFYKRWQKREEQHQKFLERQKYERSLRTQGYTKIAGIDEVGRGPLAGPVVAAAVILPEDCTIEELNDSKQLSEKKREELFLAIQKEAIGIGVGICSPEEIDEYNIYEATKIAMQRAIAQLKEQPDCLLLDAMELPLEIPQQSLIKGDAKSISIAAASIVAKCIRDGQMKEYAKEYPYYDFEHNMGYGTKNHLKGLENHGICDLHRKSFEPIKSMVEKG
ncbi:ribonuclease HII [Catellicoccus marimammalium]|uniref:Ribonuclease HII n=1 Tax=Catellicoccus marimammalium M35/04/3 TaxID=1234409 RepID=K8Z8X2_9ENTE|nr:ribonuclease HII [Catellicoccus marimammalium]EKU27340.1 Ribonuclease HII [Catellicoccus marimammalium M35/04/3]